MRPSTQCDWDKNIKTSTLYTKMSFKWRHWRKFRANNWTGWTPLHSDQQGALYSPNECSVTTVCLSRQTHHTDSISHQCCVATQCTYIILINRSFNTLKLYITFSRSLTLFQITWHQNKKGKCLWYYIGKKFFFCFFLHSKLEMFTLEANAFGK